MASPFKEGDRVQVVDRSTTTDDAKSGLFYNHFRGLVGTVQKVYATEEVAVEIEPGSLDEPILIRHTEVQESMKTRWMDGLSEEGRNRLSDAERDFQLRYTILVKMNDLGAPNQKARSAQEIALEIRNTAAEAVRSAAKAGQLKVEEAAAAVRRATEADLAAAEEAELQRRREQA